MHFSRRPKRRPNSKSRDGSEALQASGDAVHVPPSLQASIATRRPKWFFVGIFKLKSVLESLSEAYLKPECIVTLWDTEEVFTGIFFFFIMIGS